MPSLGVTWRCRIPLSEILQVVQREAPTTKEQHGVLKYRCMAVGQNDAVAIDPCGITWMMLKNSAVQHMS
jgi:hypothetical protein